MYPSRINFYRWNVIHVGDMVLCLLPTPFSANLINALVATETSKEPHHTSRHHNENQAQKRKSARSVRGQISNDLIVDVVPVASSVILLYHWNVGFFVFLSFGRIHQFCFHCLPRILFRNGFVVHRVRPFLSAIYHYKGWLLSSKADGSLESSKQSGLCHHKLYSYPTEYNRYCCTMTQPLLLLMPLRCLVCCVCCCVSACSMQLLSREFVTRF